MKLIEIPGASFRMGLDRARADRLQELHGPTPYPFFREMPEHEARVATFWMAEAPVTNDEFLEFVEVGGYDQDRFWSDLLLEAELPGEKLLRGFTNPEGWPGPLTWIDGKPRRGAEEHPVSGVSWFEAMAFCRFKGLRLPTEAEWELAARGTDGRMYPWGENFEADLCVHGARATAAVTSCPRGASPYRMLHMSGNVAQWCSDRYAPYPGSAAGSETQGVLDRVVRGDFYRGTPESLRTTARNPRAPQDRFPGLGFRCAKDRREAMG